MVRSTLVLVVLGPCFSGHAVAQDYAAAPRPFPEEASELLDPAGFAVARDAPQSSVRVSLGPSLLITQRAPLPGFAAALDLGSGAAGARFAGAWMDVGRADGLSQYSAELWLDFGYGSRLHPVVAAGAGVARLDARAADGRSTAHAAGIGILRASLEYGLPLAQVDARAAMDVSGSVPVVREDAGPNPSAWAFFGARVGVGF
jgi:hypothetical protein